MVDAPVVTNLLLLGFGLVRVAITSREESGRAVRVCQFDWPWSLSIRTCIPVRLATALVAGKGLKVDVGVHMGLEAVRATAAMAAFNPGTLKNESGSLLPG